MTVGCCVMYSTPNNHHVRHLAEFRTEDIRIQCCSPPSVFHSACVRANFIDSAVRLEREIFPHSAGQSRTWDRVGSLANANVPVRDLDMEEKR